YGSDEWNTIDLDFVIEDINIDKVVLFEIGFDSGDQGTHGSVTIDDVVFGDYSVSANPYVNAAGTGLANSFDTEVDVTNDYMAVGHWDHEIDNESDTATITWVDGAMKIESKYDWDWAMAKFLVSPDLTETIDITNNVHATFKYKNLAPEGCVLVASFLNISDATGDELLYGGEIWLESEDLVYGSDEWNTIDLDFVIEDINIDKVVLFEIGFDSGDQGTHGSVTVDDVVFGDYVVSAEGFKKLTPSGINVFPNPAYDFVTISNAGLTFSVNIYNTIGQSIMSTRNQTQVDISSLTKGFYFVEIASDGIRETHKLLVK
ncbi:MAG: T9SS type A sorting domain-containing protein, partial [Bacteroidales bacterium]|nr:T9SS type A sorting domain-containing protein [Bacteroidales bacterium]